MDIQGLGVSAVDKIVETLGVKDPADLYKLTLGDLLKLENFKEKSAGNLLSSIEASKNRELWRLIFALGILEIGEQFAKDLARKYGTLDALMAAELLRPALLIGVPVGFVNVVESKELIIEGGRAPYIVARGRKGGSNVAAAICNALLYQIRR